MPHIMDGRSMALKVRGWALGRGQNCKAVHTYRERISTGMASIQV